MTGGRRRQGTQQSQWIERRWRERRHPGLSTILGDAIAVSVILGALGALAGLSATMVLVAVPMVALSGLLVRGPRHTLQPHLLRRTGRLGAISALVALPPAVLLPDRAHEVATTAVLTVMAILSHRLVMTVVVRKFRRSHRWLEPTLVLGAGEVGQRLVAALQQRPDLGVKPIGYVDDLADGPDGLPLLGGPDDLEQLLATTHASTVVLAFGPVREPELVPALRQALATHRHVRMLALPRLYELGTLRGGEIEHLYGYPLMELAPAPHLRPAWHAKRVMDVVLAAGLLLATAPLLGVAALSVKLSSPGPVIFRQERIGLRGTPFKVLKLRTMEVNDESDTRWSVDHDPRVTPVGDLLRRTHLDELPQLVNVLRGDMSLVGPRPERPHFVDQFSEDVRGYEQRHRVPAGMTGLAQVQGLKGDTSISERARFDNRYIEDWTLWGDLSILARTISSIAGRGEPVVEHPRSEDVPAVSPDTPASDTGRP